MVATMTKLVLPLLLTACVSTERAAESQREQAASPGGFNEVFRGTEATVNYADVATRISIDVFENGSNQFPGETFLFYSFQVADPSSQVCNGDFCFYMRFITDIGFGHLPASDAQITPGAAHVHTSTSVPGFTTMQCTFDQRDFSNVCTDGIVGAIELAWQRDGASTTFSNGLFRQTTRSFSSQTTGMFWTVSAQARGSLPGGHTFESASGTLNESRGNSVSKSFEVGAQPL